MAMRAMTSQDIANVAAAYGFTPTPPYTAYWLNWFNASNGPWKNLTDDLAARGYAPISGTPPKDPRTAGVSASQLLKVGSIVATIYALMKSSR